MQYERSDEFLICGEKQILFVPSADVKLDPLVKMSLRPHQPDASFLQYLSKATCKLMNHTKFDWHIMFQLSSESR